VLEKDKAMENEDCKRHKKTKELGKEKAQENKDGKRKK
jgi:hypothetical protein